MKLTFAFCTFNRASRLDSLVGAMRAQDCPIPFEILAVNNNSSDDTVSVLGRLTAQPGAPLRFVTEMQQGIVPARNRAIEEALESDILVFIDDDELPEPGLLTGAVDSITREGAQCTGGRVRVDFGNFRRPAWLEDDLLGFLAEVDHGPEPFWIISIDTPIWTANIGYAMDIFRANPNLRFDNRYNRIGADIGGGEDGMMFRTLLAQGARIRYRPDMRVLHSVDAWKLKRSYFLRLHYRAGIRRGRYQLPTYPRTFFSVPPFLITQLIRQTTKAIGMQLTHRPGSLRQAMNATNTLGCLVGYRQRTQL